MKHEKYKTFLNPSGFIEQHYFGVQTPDSFVAAVHDLVNRSKKLKDKGQKALILVCVEEVPKIDVSGKMTEARKEAVKAMKTGNYDRIAIYGNTALQILVNTLILISGKRDKVRVFENRIDALRWLKGGA